MSPETAIVGTRVRVLGRHRREALRGLDGKIVGRYGGDGHVAVDVRHSDHRHFLFWPRDLQEVASAHPHWWRSLLEGMPAR